MKILFVQKVKALVGSEKYFLELLPALNERGIETEFVCIYAREDFSKTAPFIEAFQHTGSKLHILEIKNERQILKCTRFIRSVIKKGNFDLVHSHLIHADLWCALLKKMKRFDCPLVSTKHGYEESYIAKYGFSTEHLKPNRYYRICRFSEKYIDRSFAVSEGLRKLFVDSGIAALDKIEVIHHGFDLPELSVANNPAYRKSPHQIIVLGRIIPFKGHKYLFESLKTVKEKMEDFKLVVLGHGDAALISELQNCAKEHQLTSHVEFLGYQSNIYDYLSNSDLMVVPSIAEGFGLIFLEAMNAQIPIVGFDVPATNEVILHNETGVLVQPYDSRQLGEEIARLLNDPDLARSISKKAHQRLLEYFCLKRMTDQTIEFYQRVLHLRGDSKKSE